MSERSAIEWTEATWNPVTGCSKVSPGCAHCYAEAISLRFGRSKGPWIPANATENVVLHPERLDQPLRWRRPRMIFVNSMSDLFHEEVRAEYILAVFRKMGAAWWHTFQILTKRAERMAEVMPWISDQLQADGRAPFGPVWRHVWLGVSIENRRFVHRADLLRETPAAVRFISAEPLLGPLLPDDGEGGWEDDYIGHGLHLKGIDWVIVGGESGPGHRPMRLEWARALRDATRLWDEDEVTQLPGRYCAFFMKQLGGPRPGGAIEDLPADLQIRELPRLASTGEQR